MKTLKFQISNLLVSSVFICVHLWLTPVFAEDVIHLRAFGVPSEFKITPQDEADRLVLDAFRKKFPSIDPVSTEGLKLSGESDRTYMMEPFMQIAGDVAPDVLYVTFKRSDTYIAMKLLYPLDRYVEQLAGVSIPDSSTLSTDAYLAELRKGKNWPTIEDRVLPQCWAVMRRACPFAAQCPYRAKWNLAPAQHHDHVWCFPIGPLVMGIMYDKPLFAEHVSDGVEVRAPRDWEELIRWAKLMTDPAQNLYGIKLEVAEPGWQFLTFLYSAGGEVVKQNAAGEWYCTLDSEAAVEAAYFFARLKLEKIVRNGRTYRGVFGSAPVGGPVRYAMTWEYFDDRFLEAAAEQTKGVGPVPAGPTGLRRSEFNSKMCGIFAGLADDDRRRDAAWTYIQYFDGDDARRIRTESFVESGLGPFVRRRLLERYNTDGRYDAILRQVPPELEEMYRTAFDGGVPEPYGKNCSDVYNQMNRPLGAIWASDVVRDAIDNNRPDVAKAEIRAILKRATIKINEKMLGRLPEPISRRRDSVAWVVIAAVIAIFVAVMIRVTKAFSPLPPGEGRVRANGDRSTLALTPALSRRERGRSRARVAYLLMAPALVSIAIWMYWPLFRGSAIAFQDYAVIGGSRWVGSANFADVLFNEEFWYSLRLSIIYAILFILIGFWVPIALALLLQEVPRASVLFRTIFYLPAVLSGVVVIFLWKSFYAPDGLVNQVLNVGVWLINLLPGVRVGEFNSSWLENPGAALLCTLIPTIWVGMGPGCLIYLAALKTVPDELYEAADIDGAGIRRKIFSIALPSIRTLIAINFIGALIGAVRGASAFVLAMTGGGPFGEQGGATEVVGLKIFFTTFGQLQFGVGAAMAWVLGSMLIGFTVIQLQRLSRIEFRTAPVTTAAGAR